MQYSTVQNCIVQKRSTYLRKDGTEKKDDKNMFVIIFFGFIYFAADSTKERRGDEVLL